MPLARFAEQLGLEAESIFFLDERPKGARPAPGIPDRRLVGARMPSRLARGFLRLARVAERPDTLLASWSDPTGEVWQRALVGPDVRLEEVAARKANLVLGGLVVPDPLPASGVEALGLLEHVVLMLDVQGVVPWAATLAQLGIDATQVRWQRAPLERVGIAIAEGNWPEVGVEVAALTTAQLETVTTGLLIQPGREDDAARLLALACEQRPESGAAWFQRGAVAFLRGELDDAVRFYSRATQARDPEARAWANLAAIHRRRGDAAEGLRCAEAAHAAMPSDPLSLGHLLGCLLQLGRQEEAHKLLTGSALDELQRKQWEEHVREKSAPALGPDTFPHLARAAYECARTFRHEAKREAAAALLRRCVTFEPSHLEGRLELGTVLSELGRDAEAEAAYSEGLDRAAVAGEAAVLRFNRAHCRIRSGNLAAAREDLGACLALLPDWADAKAVLAAISNGG